MAGRFYIYMLIFRLMDLFVIVLHALFVVLFFKGYL